MVGKECLALLSAYGTEEIQKKVEGTHKNADIYRKISDIMKKKAYTVIGCSAELNLNT
jgi:hypothetical protein